MPANRPVNSKVTEQVMGNYISKIFGASPVGPIQDHMDACYKCSKELITFFGHVVNADWDKVEASRTRIVELEHEADDLKKQIRSQLPKSLFMPVPRQDLLELLLVQDRIANRARDVSGLVLGRRMTIPPTMQQDFLAFVSRNVDAAKQARKSIRELDELYETGFRGAEAKLVESLVEELDQIEDDTDVMQARIRTELFSIEKDLPPVDVIFLYRVIELTGEIGDMAERIGRRLEVILSH
jgi:predicted phosphate transport protein (TIGR00153 family)